MLSRCRVEEIVLGLFDDLGRVHEEQKVAIAAPVKVQDQRRHQHRLTAARGHVEQKVRGFRSSLVFVDVEQPTLQRRALIGA